MVSLILPTANRPEMLRQALRSVSAQTRRDRISRVLVSENGGNQASRKICAEFPELPVNYVFRVPATTAVEHGRLFMAEGMRDEFTAILHDDDWWDRCHLEQALKALEEHKDAAAYFASVFEVCGEVSVLRCESNFCFWFGAGYLPLTNIWELNNSQVILASLLATPGRYSALVARTAALRRSCDSLPNAGNPFDTDRMFAVDLSKQGTVLYNPVPQVFIRTHALQDQLSFASEKRVELTAKTTDWIIATAAESPAELARRFVAAVQNCPPNARTVLDFYLSYPWCLRRMALHAEMERELRQILPGAKTGTAAERLKHAIRQFIPPVLLSAKRMVAQSFRKA